jgi:hypothetical protein
MDLTPEKIYEEANEIWRFLAKWRQLAFAGYLAVLAGTLSFTNFAVEHAYTHWVIGGCLLLFSGISFILWIADRRTHRLTMHACTAGAELEGTRPGFFRVNARLDAQEGVRHDGRAVWSDSHSRAAALLFLGSTLVFFLAGIGAFIGAVPTQREQKPLWEYSIVGGPLTANATSPASLGQQLDRAAAEGWEFVAIGGDPSTGSFIIVRRHKK